jgi:hypothetical protein
MVIDLASVDSEDTAAPAGPGPFEKNQLCGSWSMRFSQVYAGFFKRFFFGCQLGPRLSPQQNDGGGDYCDNYASRKPVEEGGCQSKDLRRVLNGIHLEGHSDRVG